MKGWTVPNRLRVAFWIIGVVAYVTLELFAAFSGNDRYAALGLFVLACALFFPGLAELRALAWGWWLAVVAALAIGWGTGTLAAVLDSIAVFLNALVGWVFARTLLRGREPLVTWFARQAGGEEHVAEPGVRSYSKTLTKVWAGVLLGQAVLLGLAWLGLHASFGWQPSAALRGALEAWLRYGSYVVMGLLFLIEYPWRRHCLPHSNQPGFLQMTRRVTASWRNMVRGEPG